MRRASAIYKSQIFKSYWSGIDFASMTQKIVMKKIFVLLIAVISITLISCTAEVVATRPADVVYARPTSPGSGYVWIGGDWYGRDQDTPGMKVVGTGQEKEGPGMTAVGNPTEMAGDGGRGTGRPMRGFAH